MGGRGLDSCDSKCAFGRTEIRREGSDWTVPSQDMIDWRCFVSAVMNLDFPLK